MAQRKISAKLELTGEQAYKNAVKEINSSLRVLNSEMKLTSAEFAENADSVEALRAKYDVQERQALTLREKIETLEKALRDSAQAYGEADERTKNWQVSLNNAQAEAAQLGNAMDATAEQIQALESAEEDAQNSTEKLGDAIKDTEPKTVELGDAVGTVSSKLGIDLPDGATKALNGLGKVNAGAVAAAGAVAGLVVAAVKAKKALDEMTLESGQRAEELLKLSSVSGVSADALQKFQFAEDFVGVSSDTLADSLKDLTKNMSDAANGNEEYAAKFDALGVSITNTDGSLRDSYDVFLDVIDALGEMGNKTERDAAAMGLINESAQQLNPLIEAGTDALRAYGDEAERMGAVLSEDDLEALKAVDDAQNRLKKTQEAVTDQISLQYAPHMAKALNKTSELVESLGSKLVESGIVDSFGQLLEFAVELFEPVEALASIAIPALGTALDGLRGTVAWILDAKDALVGLLTLDFSKVGVAMGYGMNTTGEMSHIQQWKYGSQRASAGGWVQDSSGKWVANGYNAGGTDYWRGGMTRVGETGPETVYLPQGAQIRTAQETRGEHATVVIQNMTVDASSLQSMQDIIDFFDNLERYSRMGVT